MSLLDYQIAAKEFAKYPKEHALSYTTLGLVGEAGEVANKVKKIIRDNNGVMTAEMKQQIAQELGDVMWYVAALAGELGYRLEDICFQNIAKLDDRFKRNVINGTGDNR
jgi:NTP pyrophosphatase (non-canonical NTP hydrolase)